MPLKIQVETQVHQESSGMGVQQDANNILANPTNILKNERFYVPIQRSHFAVIAAIEEFRGPHVILLHGGVGKGKSTLARYMFERYGQDGDCGNQFEHVIWASCANCSVDEASGKQFQILQDHAPSSLLDSMPKEAKGPKPRIRKAYRDFLIGNKILMILDDVSDPRFLNEMWMAVMGAKNVKYLVTSQRANICNSLKNDALLIAMEDPTQDETRNILASLVGLHDKIIPGHLQVSFLNFFFCILYCHLIIITESLKHPLLRCCSTKIPFFFRSMHSSLLSDALLAFCFEFRK